MATVQILHIKLMQTFEQEAEGDDAPSTDLSLIECCFYCPPASQQYSFKSQ